ncbi:MAG TPA: hypothetical protein PKE69_15740 [Pyrinomonadaceae bacterium]|nr:hypothetical protein [Pyrinomonadaceae bacterium]
MPLRDLSAEQLDKYLGIGISDPLVNKLSKIQTLSVRPSNSVLKFAEAQSDLTNAGRELNVETVLPGNLQRDGERLRVSVQLVRTLDKSVIWANRLKTAPTIFSSFKTGFQASLTRYEFAGKRCEN